MGTMALANPIDGVDVGLLNTSDWTTEDWEAALCLTEQLELRNAAKGAGGGAYNQGSIRSMWRSPLYRAQKPHLCLRFLGDGSNGRMAGICVGNIQEGSKNEKAEVHSEGSSTARSCPALVAGHKTGNSVYDTSTRARGGRQMAEAWREDREMEVEGTNGIGDSSPAPCVFNNSGAVFIWGA